MIKKRKIVSNLKGQYYVVVAVTRLLERFYSNNPKEIYYTTHENREQKKLVIEFKQGEKNE